MVVLRKSGIPDYSLCQQVVTVYHRAGADAITRTVYDGVHLEYGQGRSIDRTGGTQASTFLLVIPGADAHCEPQDKILPGIGPEVADDAAWRALIPAKVEGLLVARHIDRYPWDGGFPHLEVRG